MKQRDFYKHNGRPILKTFLIALFTYEVLYWSWLKLESIEVKHDKEGTQNDAVAESSMDTEN